MNLFKEHSSTHTLSSIYYPIGQITVQYLHPVLQSGSSANISGDGQVITHSIANSFLIGNGSSHLKKIKF